MKTLTTIGLDNLGGLKEGLPYSAHPKQDPLTVEWLPQLGTQILVFERETLQLVGRGETDPWFQWHLGNGYLDSGGSVSLDFVRYGDFWQTNQHLKEVATGQTSTLAKGTLWQMRLNPKNGEVISLEEVMSRSVEFPIVSPSQVGQEWSSTYITVHRQGTDIQSGKVLFFDTCGNFKLPFHLSTLPLEHLLFFIPGVFCPHFRMG